MHRHTKAGMIMLLSGAMMLNTVTCAFAAGNTDGSPTVLLQGPGAASPAPETSVSDNSPDGSPVIHVGQTEQDETSAGGPGVSSSGTIEQGTGSPAPSGGVSDNSPDGSPVIHVGQTEQDETSAGGPGVSSSGTIEQGTGSPAPSGGGAAASPDGSPVIHVGQTEQDETSAGGPGVSSSGTIEQGTGSPAPSGGGAAAPEIPQPPSGETPLEAGSGELTEEQGAQLEAEQQAAQQEAQQESNPLTVPDRQPRLQTTALLLSQQNWSVPYVNDQEITSEGTGYSAISTFLENIHPPSWKIFTEICFTVPTLPPMAGLTGRSMVSRPLMQPLWFR